MNAGQKEKIWIFVGLGVVLVGVAWFALALVGALDDMAMMLGYFLGPGLALGGLIIVGVYFFRWQRIQKLLRGEDVLVRWGEGESQTILAPTCAYANGELYLWGAPGTRLEGVQIEQGGYAGSARSYLRITIGEATQQRSVTGSILWRKRELSVRIPQGQELAAQRVVEQLEDRLYKG